jgi:hypothetical protein
VPVCAFPASGFALTDADSHPQTVMVLKLGLNGRIRHITRILQTSSKDARSDPPARGPSPFTGASPTRRSENHVSMSSIGSFCEDPITLPRAPCGWTPDSKLLGLGEAEETMAKRNGHFRSQIIYNTTPKRRPRYKISIICCDRKLKVAIGKLNRRGDLDH